MADLDFRQGQNIPESMITRYKDLGGGVYAKVVAAVIAAGSAVVGIFNMNRDNSQQNLTYAAAVNPTALIDKRKHPIVVVGPIPAACNGLTMTPIVASGAAGADMAIPYFTDSGGTKTAFYGVAVATGEFWTIQAEIAGHPFFGLRFSGAGVTTTIPVWLMG